MRIFRLPPKKPPTPEEIATKTASRRSRTGRARGRKFEKSTAEDIREALGAHPDDVKRTPAAVSGKDVILHHALRWRFPYSVECKDHKSLAVPSWIKQAEETAKKDGGELEPIVVFKLAGNSKKYVIIEFDHFLKITVDHHDTKGKKK